MQDPVSRTVTVERGGPLAEGLIHEALLVLRTDLEAATRGERSRELAIAITHLEEALLRLRHGTPR